MLKTTKILFSLVLVAALFLVLFTALPLAYAEETTTPDTSTEQPQNEPVTEPQTPETVTDEKTDENEVTGIVDRFIENLKEKYGEDYEYYLNTILEQWGSVEAYLLAQTDNLPDELQAGYADFIGWLGKYASVWAPCLAVALIIIGFIVGKKALNTILNKIVEARIKPIQDELNKQSEAQAAQLQATRALLGTNEKFAQERKAAEDAEKKLLE